MCADFTRKMCDFPLDDGDRAVDGWWGFLPIKFFFQYFFAIISYLFLKLMLACARWKRANHYPMHVYYFISPCVGEDLCCVPDKRHTAMPASSSGLIAIGPSPWTAHGKVFVVCFSVFVVCLWHTTKYQILVVVHS